LNVGLQAARVEELRNTANHAAERFLAVRFELELYRNVHAAMLKSRTHVVNVTRATPSLVTHSKTLKAQEDT
jgi:hypothetical protein